MTKTTKTKAVRAMTKAEATRCMLGDLSLKSCKEAAAILGVKYSSVYSARCGDTHKTVHAEMLRLRAIWE